MVFFSVFDLFMIKINMNVFRVSSLLRTSRQKLQVIYFGLFSAALPKLPLGFLLTFSFGIHMDPLKIMFFLVGGTPQINILVPVVTL